MGIDDKAVRHIMGITLGNAFLHGKNILLYDYRHHSIAYLHLSQSVPVYQEWYNYSKMQFEMSEIKIRDWQYTME